jgi:hypothetical protein
VYRAERVLEAIEAPLGQEGEPQHGWGRLMPDGGTVTAFQDTEVAPLPVEWELVPLGCLADMKYGKARPRGPYAQK